MLVQLYTVFEKDIDVGLGHIKRSKNERKELANKSIEFNSNKLSHIYSKFNMDNLNDGKLLNIKDDNIKDDNIKDEKTKKKRKDKIIDNIEDKIEKKIKKKDKEKNIVNDEKKTDEVPKKKRGRPKKIEK